MVGLVIEYVVWRRVFDIIFVVVISNTISPSADVVKQT